MAEHGAPLAGPSADELRAELAAQGVALGDAAVAQRCAALCAHHGMSATQLASAWEAFALNHRSGADDQAPQLDAGTIEVGWGFLWG